MSKLQKTLPFLFTLLFILSSTVVHAQTPFSIEVYPLTTEAEQGEQVHYSIELTAEEGFEDSIDITLEVSFLTITRTYDIGTAHPPYPKSFEHSFTVPEEVPSGITINGKILASSFETVVEENVQLKIPGGNILENIINLINQILSQIIEAITNLF